MIEISGVSKKFGSNLALDNISFNVRQGEVLGFLGPNGAGKTTTMKIITGFWQATQGSVTVAGIDVAKDALAVRQKIGYLPETVPLYDEMKVFEYLKFVAEARSLPKEKIIARIKQVAESCGLQQVIGRSIEELSKGFRQRVGLAQAIMHNPDILILDEPTTGLDPNQIAEIRDLIKQVGKEKTVIFSTHILAEAQATCDRVVIINQGKIAGEGRPEELAKSMNRNSYRLKTKGPQDSILLMLRALPNVVKVEAGQQESGDIYEYLIQPSPGADVREQIAERMLANNWPILEFSGQAASLEEVFRELTK